MERQSTFRRVLRLARPYVGLLLQVLAVMFVLASLRLVQPWPVKFIVDSAIPRKDTQLLLMILLGLFFLNVFRQIMTFTNTFVISYVGSRLVFDMRRKLFQHLQKLSLSYYDSKRPGEIMARLMSDVTAIKTLITGSAMQMLIEVFMFVSTLIIIFTINLKLAIVAVAILPFQVGTYFLFNKRVSASNRRVRQKVQEIHGSAYELVSGAKVVKSFNAETRASRTFVQDAKEMFDMGIDFRILSMQWGTTTEALGSLGRLVFIWFGVSAVIHGEIALGTYLAYVTYVGMLQAPIKRLISMIGQILPAKVGIERVFEILDMAPEVEEVEDPVNLKDMKGFVEFKNACFSYDGEEDVLRDVTFGAKPGETVALVGPSGSGKSTIANLIARFYDRTEGEILIDGHDIRDLYLKTFRDQIGTVLQETYLFTGTIADNIRYGRPEASHEEVVAAAQGANAHEFIEQLPDDYDTELGAMGVRLSGGQRQRIAIARAILRNPRILILDEATSALDTATEAKVQEALGRLMQARTTFVIAHRLSTIKNADKIIVMREGKVEQVGSHDQLMVIDGLYRELYQPLEDKEAAKAKKKAG